jgi:hypothetical protein
MPAIDNDPRRPDFSLPVLGVIGKGQREREVPVPTGVGSSDRRLSGEPRSGRRRRCRGARPGVPAGAFERHPRARARTEARPPPMRVKGRRDDARRHVSRAGT